MFRGKFAGRGNRRATPAGLYLQDVILSVETNIPWKQKKTMNVYITCCGNDVDRISQFKVGEKLSVEGMIEQTGKDENEKLKLIATKIEKER